MKYKLEYDSDTGIATETLTRRGREYSRKIKDMGNGVKEFGEVDGFPSSEFCEALEYDGESDGYFLDDVWDALDSSFFVTSVMDLGRYT